MDQRNTRKVVRPKRRQVVTVTIPAIVLTIDAEVKDGRLSIGISAPQTVVISNPVDSEIPQNAEHG